MIYFIYGLSGPMKKLFTDILRETVALGADADVASPNAKWAAFNIKGVTRNARFYDDGLVDVKHAKTDGSENSVTFVKTAREVLLEDKEKYSEDYMYQSPHGDSGGGCWYAINIAQIESARRDKIDHFVVCNSANTILNLVKKYGKDDCKVIKVSRQDTRDCFEYLEEKYKEVKAEIEGNGGVVKDISLEERIAKATIFMGADNSFDIRNTFKELEGMGVLKEIKLEAKAERIEDELRGGLLDILNKNSKNFDWKRLLSTRRIFDCAYTAKVFNPYKTDDAKESFLDPFIKDYNEISALSSFRRMQDKCQVFPLKRYDYARTRLTHSIEVAATAEALGESAVRFIREKRPHHYDRICRGIPTLLKNAALLHDMGNPPFGHFSEDAIRRWFKNNWRGILGENDLGTIYKNDLEHYEGNAQLFRLATTLANFGDGKNGECCSPNLTMASIAATVKYPTSSGEVDSNKTDICRKKNGYFLSEKEYFEKINDELGLNFRRHPLAFLLEAADDITYYASDLEDALKRKLVSLDDLLRETNAVHEVACNVCKELKRLKVASSSETNIEQTAIKGKVEKHLCDEYLANGKNIWVVQARVETLVKLKDEIEKKIDSLKDAKDKIDLTSRTDLSYKKLRTFIKDCLLEETKEAFRQKYDSIMNRTEENFKGELLNVSNASLIKMVISNILVKYVYHSKELVHNQLKAAVALDTILNAFVKAALKLGFDEETLKANKPEDITDINIFLLFSDNYKLACRRAIKEIDNKEKLNSDEKARRKAYNCIMLAMDVFAGMTDSYAMEIYHLLTASL